MEELIWDVNEVGEVRSGTYRIPGHDMYLLCTEGLPKVKSVITTIISDRKYHLYVINPNGTCTPLQPLYSQVNVIDYNYNPLELMEYAVNNNFDIDKAAYQMIVGRWEIEVYRQY